MHGVKPVIRASKLHLETSDMRTTENHHYDVVITEEYDRDSDKQPRIVRVEKAGVVLWPTERHTSTVATEPATNVVDPSRAGDYMIGGSHYKSPDTTGMCPHCRRPVEHWDWSFNLRGLEYAATKYIARWRDKDGLASLKKAIHYVQKIINIHFPEVVVTVSYSNNAGRGVSKVTSGKEVAKGSPTHPEADLEVGD